MNDRLNSTLNFSESQTKLNQRISNFFHIHIPWLGLIRNSKDREDCTQQTINRVCSFESDQLAALNELFLTFSIRTPIQSLSRHEAETCSAYARAWLSQLSYCHCYHNHTWWSCWLDRLWAVDLAYTCDGDDKQ